MKVKWDETEGVFYFWLPEKEAEEFRQNFWKTKICEKYTLYLNHNLVKNFVLIQLI